MIMYDNADNCMEIFWGLFMGGGGLLERVIGEGCFENGIGFHSQQC